MIQKRGKDIIKRSRKFAVLITRFVNIFLKTPAGFKIGGQLVAFGTFVDANIGETQDTISRRGFIKK